MSALAEEMIAARVGVLAAMTAEEHRAEALRCAASAEGVQPHEPRQRAMAARAQWHATMALVEQGRGH